MNTALVLFTTWAAAGGSGCGCTTCNTGCNTCATVTECCESEGFLQRLRDRMKSSWGRACNSGCDSCCQHPGPIPCTEHPTCKQRICDRVCPETCCPKSNSCSTCGCNDECGGGRLRGLFSRLFGRKSECDDCCGCGTVITAPGAPANPPKMPKGDEPKKTEVNPEAIPGMPSAMPTGAPLNSVVPHKLELKSQYSPY